MPVSRNRKKKNNQNNKPKAKAINQRIDDCRNCESLRDEFTFEELLDVEQTHWARSGVVRQIGYFLYCPNYDEYSAILEMDDEL
ncbi:hypothetical protein C8N40_102115 [Pontibacter mucosus]|uniref:Uncharacterized protein n=1 Tax=Pontibacter mucosus TaxID=1649266 RepID=A0A2T5YPA6_9BACT|nr:hypothetical protein [Pontibacter mucosus]PTX21146.1 hypothetical protein C8N40_102115 [Pontibacter mucosus]